MSSNRSTNTAHAWLEFPSETEAGVSAGSPSKVVPLVKSVDDSKGLFAFPSEASDDGMGEASAKLLTGPDEPGTLQASESSTSQPSVKRWTVAFAASFVFGAASVMVMLQFLDRPSAGINTVRDDLTVQSGIPRTFLDALQRVDMRPPVPVARPKRVPPPRVAATEPEAPPLDIKPDEIVTAYTEPAAPTAAPGNGTRAAVSDEQAVRQKLRAYESYQGAGFRACSVVVAGESATAECRGTIPQVASPDSPSSDYQWTFKMRRDGAAWKIDEVSRSSPMDVPRTPGHE